MIIIYKPKTPHLLKLPVGKSFISGFKKAKRKDGVSNTIILVPGTNDINVSDKEWQKVKEYTMIKEKIKIGELKIIEEEIEKKPDKNGNMRSVFKEKTIESLNVEEAIQIIKDCNNMDSLKKWSNEKGLKEEVRLTIKQQIEKINEYIKTGIMPKEDN